MVTTFDTLNKLVDTANMSAKPVQISMDEELLERVDADPETLEKGRSAFVRSAIEIYLTAKERQEIDRRIVSAYRGEADAMLDEISDLLGEQVWPEE